MNTAHERIVADYNRAILSKDPALLAGLYAPGARHELPFAHSAAATLTGPDQIERAYTAAWSAAPVTPVAITTTAVHETADGRTCILEEDIELRAAGGDRFTVSTVVVLTIDGGRIVHARDYTDDLTIATHLGQAPEIVSG